MNKNEKYQRLCLASHSPRRRLLLESLGAKFEVRAAADSVEENLPSDGRIAEPSEIALGRARLKGEAVQSVLQAEGVRDLPVLAADTVVCLDERILDKPANSEQATEFLRLLSGRKHRVITGLWLSAGELVLSDHRVTRVCFDSLSKHQIAAYVKTGEPYDKAGGYGIQGCGGALVTSIEGCYFNVMGLPLNAVGRLLDEARIERLLCAHSPSA